MTISPKHKDVEAVAINQAKFQFPFLWKLWGNVGHLYSTMFHIPLYIYRDNLKSTRVLARVAAVISRAFCLEE